MVEKQSFISNLIGRQTYDDAKEFAKTVAWIGAAILALLYLLSYYFHSSIISFLLNITNGYSLLFIGYIVVLMVLLDFEVKVEAPERKYWEEKKEIAKPFKYKLTVVWSVLLLLLGIVAIYYSNKYRRQYSFECDTFLVDKSAGIYHYDWNSDCETAETAESLEEMNGFQINKSFKLCEECKECEEELAP
ncbi:hypothetical protein [Xylanibacter ruminicola]|uniref:Uncharacterized protein n=1 Tax=Xylanibacter ruminicola TaxID=839 RepID=A0A1M6UE13_XYLRU|nr:hypothetical protein [Xylanibacter ruminicola]SHK67407.1 hypothetical protein SAMN05216463_1099 [Xylanibacter ruminicola]